MNLSTVSLVVICDVEGSVSVRCRAGRAGKMPRPARSGFRSQVFEPSKHSVPSLVEYAE